MAMFSAPKHCKTQDAGNLEIVARFTSLLQQSNPPVRAVFFRGVRSLGMNGRMPREVERPFSVGSWKKVVHMG